MIARSPALSAAMLAAALVAAPVTARAEGRDEQAARVAFDRGVALGDQGRWAEALEAFEQADRLAPSPGVTFNLAATLRALGRYVEARRLLERALRDDAPLAARVKPALRADMARLLDEVRPKVGHVTVELDPPDADLSVDGTPTQLPTDRTLDLDPGKHVLIARAAGHDTVSSTLSVSPGNTRVTLRAPRSVAVARPVVVEPPSLLRSAWLWGAIGVALAGGALTFALMSRDAGPSPSPAAGPPRTTVDRVVPLRWSF